jgi:hypothetical protein
MSDIDDEPRGRSAAGAVIIAVIFLAILGTGVGIVLGSANKKDGGDDVGSGPTGTPAPTVSVTETTGPGGSGTDPGGATGTKTRNPTNTSTYPAVTKSECPRQTQERAGASLSVTIYIKTARAEVWICSGGGRTVYQGHLLGQPFTAATSDFSLYIGTVRYEAGVWAATNGATTYYVSRDRLRQEENGVEKVNDLVTDRYEA